MSPPPSFWGLDPFYQKYCSASGIAVVAANVVPNGASSRDADHGSDARTAARYAILGVDENVTDLPELASSGLTKRG